MDIRCGRCQSESQVEDANVSDLGTEVRCSDCGHVFLVKRQGSAASTANTSREPKGKSAGTWVIETEAGRPLRLRDLTTLHKWIIERRVGREDRLARDGAPWQRLGDVAQLVPFFDIAESAERARTADRPMPVPLPTLLPAPLAVPALEPPAPLPQPHLPEPSAFEPASALAAPARPLAPTKAQTRTVTAAPHSPLYDAGADQTVIIRQAPAKRHGFLKLGITVLVAAAVAYLGILWQYHRLISAMISSSGTSESSGPPTVPVVVLPTPTPGAAPNAEAAGGSAKSGDANARSPEVEPIAD
ncbi:MAG TPA: zinc-ribbon domain-containing protein, partial [Polyangia bacterium]